MEGTQNPGLTSKKTAVSSSMNQTLFSSPEKTVKGSAQKRSPMSSRQRSRGGSRGSSGGRGSSRKRSMSGDPDKEERALTYPY